MVTGAGLATVNRLPVLLLPGDTYATRHQGPVLQQLQHPIEADTSVNDAFRPGVPVLRPDHPARAAAHRAARRRCGCSPTRSTPAPSSSPCRRTSSPTPTTSRWSSSPSGTGRSAARADPDEVAAVAELLAEAESRPLIIAGGGVVYSGATAELERLAERRGSRSRRRSRARARSSAAPGGSSAASAWKATRRPTPWPAEADLVLTVGSRLTDFATASHSLFQNPDVRFASINVVNVDDATGSAPPASSADAKRALAALTEAVRAERHHHRPRPGGTR
jgi:3D-(3,5/4)-trihydroxycyclohexane-1,2-dione acylhydrolase (decyclizing)